MAGRFFTNLSHQGSPRILEWVACPPPGDLPNPGTEPSSPALQADSLPSEFPFYKEGKPIFIEMIKYIYMYTHGGKYEHSLYKIFFISRLTDEIIRIILKYILKARVI